MSVQTEFAKIDALKFGRIMVKLHDALDPILTDDDNLETLGDIPDVRKALNQILAELKTQKLKLDYFRKRI